MPIDCERFERGEPEGSIESKIIDLLVANPDTDYNVREIAIEVMGEGLSERNLEHLSDTQPFMGEFLDIATTSTILDRLVDNGRVHRRLVDTGEGLRSYYRAPPAVTGE